MVSIGTWNLENFAPPGASTSSPDNQQAYATKLDSLAATSPSWTPTSWPSRRS